MAVAVQENATARVSSLDTLRAFLVAWIIGGHALLGYSSIGGWAYDEVNEVTLSPQTERVLAPLLGPSALFFMGTFFLVAGLFTPHSLARKGTGRFARDRLVRLGVPFLATILVLWPLFLWLTYLAAGREATYWGMLTGRHRILDAGALWFTEVLLIFSLAYAAWRLLPRRGLARTAPRISGAWLAWLAVVIALVTFAVRLWFPARSTQIGDLHVWQWPQLAAMFALGIAWARHGLAERVPRRLWHESGAVALLTIVAVPGIAGAMGVNSLAGDDTPFLGGWNIEAMLMASAEAVLVVFGSIWLLGAAQRVFSHAGRFSRALARSSFAAFILQGPVLLGLAVALRPLGLPAEAKAAAVAVLGIVVCFALGWPAVTRTRLGRFM